MQTSEHLDDRYHDTVIGKTPEKFDAIEVQGVRISEDEDDESGLENCEVNNDDPQFYTVYVHEIGEGVQAVADIGRREVAQAFAAQLSAHYGWPIHDYTKDRPS